MPNNPDQSVSNYTRYDPLFHFFVLPLFGISAIAAIVNLVWHPGWHSAFITLIAIGLLIAILKMRMYALKVQDRVIRLEERGRLALLLDPSLRPRILDLTEAQLIALRFASDAELPALATRALNEKLAPADIRKAIQHWRADYWRV
jgi:uncharacterized membrane protein YdbT with pleckstrin-like domain